MTPEEKLAYNAQISREQHQAKQVRRQQERDRQIPPLQVQTWDSDRGALRATTPDGTVRYVQPITNGAIAAGDVTRPGKNRIDGMPHKRREVVVPPVVVKAGILYLGNDARLAISFGDYTNAIADVRTIGRTAAIQSLTSANLKKGKVLITVPFRTDRFYAEEEAIAIQSFVAQGGGLLVIGDNGLFRNSLNSLVSSFGVQAGSDILPTPWVRAEGASSPLFGGKGGNVTSVIGTGGGSWAVLPEAAAIAMIEAGDPSKSTAVTLNYGQGRVVLLADSNMFSQDNLYLNANYQNKGLLVNAVSWLLK